MRLSSGGKQMDDEQKKWQEQYWKNSGGTKEVFRFGCAFAILLGIGIGLYFWSGSIGYMLICIAFYFSFPTLTAYWQPTYSLLRKILGNENIPPKLMPSQRKWWSYIPLVIRLGISTALLIKGIEWLIQ
jgi:hypothetical protein